MKIDRKFKIAINENLKKELEVIVRLAASITTKNISTSSDLLKHYSADVKGSLIAKGLIREATKGGIPCEFYFLTKKGLDFYLQIESLYQAKFEPFLEIAASDDEFFTEGEATTSTPGQGGFKRKDYDENSNSA